MFLIQSLLIENPCDFFMKAIFGLCSAIQKIMFSHLFSVKFSLVSGKKFIRVIFGISKNKRITKVKSANFPDI
jgi:hypothetical protein